MPDDCPEIKRKNVRGYGAEIILSEPILEKKMEKVRKLETEKEYAFIPPYDNYDVITGQATCMVDII